MPKWSSLVHKMKIPFIGMTSMEGSLYMHSLLGNAVHPVIYPMQELELIYPLTLKERVIITAATAVYKLATETLLEFFSRKLNEKYFGRDCPTNFEMDSRASLIFLISNPIFVRPRPVTPRTINLDGGLHITEAKELPKVRILQSTVSKC